MDGFLKNHSVHRGTKNYRDVDYSWNPNKQLGRLLDVNNRKISEFTYDAFGNLASGKYEDGTTRYKLPDEVGNLYETKEKDDRQYGKSGRLEKDREWYYFYDALGNLTKKTKNIDQEIKESFAEELKKNPIKKQLWIDKVFGVKERPTEPDLVPKTNLETWGFGEWHYRWYANGMLQQVIDPKGKRTQFEYDALGRRTAKIGKEKIYRYIYDGNVLLHEFDYALESRPKIVANDIGELSFDREEPKENLVTWVFEEGTFVPQAKITEEGSYSIISDHLEGGALRKGLVDLFSERASWRVGKRRMILEASRFGNESWIFMVL